MSPIQQAFSFLIKTLFDLYLLLVLLRFLFQYFKVDFYNPFSQFILKATNPILLPIRRILPSYDKIDLASLVLLLSLKACEFLLLSVLTRGMAPNILGLLIWPIGELMNQTVNVFFFAILVMIILSWLGPKVHTPISSLVAQMTDPLLRPARRVIPAMAGIDLSPMIVLLGLKLIEILLANPITQLGIRLAL